MKPKQKRLWIAKQKADAEAKHLAEEAIRKEAESVRLKEEQESKKRELTAEKVEKPKRKSKRKLKDSEE